MKVCRLFNYDANYHAMKTFGPLRVVNLGSRWRWLISTTPLPLYPQGNSRSTHCMGGWVGPRAGLDVMEKRKNLLPSQGIESRLLGRPAHSIVAIPTELSRRTNCNVSSSYYMASRWCVSCCRKWLWRHQSYRSLTRGMISKGLLTTCDLMGMILD
jgi:hypothetical protein